MGQTFSRDIESSMFDHGVANFDPGFGEGVGAILPMVYWGDCLTSKAKIVKCSLRLLALVQSLGTEDHDHILRLCREGLYEGLKAGGHILIFADR
jgi:hypothetical protein